MECKRCGYKTNRRETLIHHFMRKVLCPSNIKDISRDELLRQFPSFNIKQLQCKSCSKQFSSSGEKVNIREYVWANQQSR